jgi:uncharacterized protein YcfJ
MKSQTNRYWTVSTTQTMWALSTSVVISLTGCAHSGPHQTAGTVIGTGLGAVAGGIIGANTGDPNTGLLVGAATGALAGGILGNAKDARDERDAAVAHAAYVQNSMTNYDLVQLTANGVSPDVIVGMVRERGGRFDLSPPGVISLKQQGVSDQVILACQYSHSTLPARHVSEVYPAPPAPVYVSPGPAVIVEPAPVFIARRRPPHYWHHHHCGPEFGVGFHFD